MKKNINPLESNFQDTDALNNAIALNIENFLNNHVREGAKGSQQNMAARRDSWNPLAMKNIDNNNLSGQNPTI
jgi:hypothetical protein